MKQLDLFAHAPRHYHEALQRLASLDLGGCRAALGEHRVAAPAGPDPGPVEEAVAWIESRVGGPRRDVDALGQVLLATCRDLREGRAPAEVLGLGGATTECVTRALARRALQIMAEAGLLASHPLSQDLPWGVFHLWSGDPAAARRTLLAHATARGDAGLAWVALGDACWASRWPAEAWGAYREGFGLAPWGGGWRPVCPAVAELPGRFSGDPLFSGPWWAVGAYLEGVFPAFERAPREVVSRRWQRFLRLREAGQERGEGAAALFFAGLSLSEHGLLLPAADLGLVRETLQRLHPEGWELHREQLEAGDARRVRVGGGTARG